MKNKKAGKIALTVLGSFVGLWILVLVAIQIVLTPAVLKKIVDNVAPEFVDGDLEFSSIKASVFRNFPNLNVTVDSLSVTYPTERYAAVGAGSDWYTSRGRGQTRDTLVSFSRFSASVNIASLASGKIRVPRLRLSKPRIFATIYEDGSASWEVFKFMASDSLSVADSLTAGDTLDLPAATADASAMADSAATATADSLAATHSADSLSAATEKGAPLDLRLGRIRLDDTPVVIFSSLPDSLRASIIVKRMTFNGILSRRAKDKGTINFEVDSLFMTGRLPADTLALKLDNLTAEAGKGSLTASAEATTSLATRSFGRLRLPIAIDAGLEFPRDSAGLIKVEHLKASLAAIPLTLSGEFRILDNGLSVKGEGSIDDCKISQVLEYFGKYLPETLQDMKTDAALNLTAAVDGVYTRDGQMPIIDAKLTIPPAHISLPQLKQNMNVELQAALVGDSVGVITADIAKLYAKSPWLNLDASLNAKDLLGDDPVFDVDGDLGIDLNSLDFKPEMIKNYDMSGGISLGLDGKIKMSQLSMYTFPEANISGYAKSDSLVIISPADSITIYADSLDIWLGAVGNTRDKSVAQGERMLAVVAGIDSLYLNYKDNMFLKGRALSLKAQNSAAILSHKDSATFYPFGGRFETPFLQLRSADSTEVTIANTDNIFKISPKATNKEVPVLSLTSEIGRLSLRGPMNRLVARDFSGSVTAAMNSIERRKKIKELQDSLVKVYPDIPRDSVLRHAFFRTHGRGERPPMPDWLTDEDLRKKDFNFKLDETMAKYYREWDVEGSLALSRANLMTPMYPLRTAVRDFSCSFNNNELNLKKLNLVSGKSWVSVSGQLTELRRALLRNAGVKLNLDLVADRLDFNEMIGAIAKGSELMLQMGENMDFSSMDDSEFEDLVVMDETDTTGVDALLIVPANIDATVTLNAKNVKYSTLSLKSLTSNLAVKERCVQLTNTSGTSDMGDLFFEGFYSTKTKHDIKTGFTLGFSDITAEKVIEMMPAVDTIMPLLKSFRGKLNCELAATASMDTTMSIIMPSMNGVMRISGKNLELDNDASIKQIAKILKFKDKETSRIDEMSVEGMLSDSRLEIFPFVLGIDRYTLAMSGVQNLDSSFKYHVSVIESPLVFRLGIDLSGTFDDFKFKIGKAKYKSVNVPVFSTVIDQTKLNLVESIHNIFKKGVEAAIEENQRQSAIADFKAKTNYVQAVDEQLDTLSTTEQAQYEAQTESE